MPSDDLGMWRRDIYAQRRVRRRMLTTAAVLFPLLAVLAFLSYEIVRVVLALR